MKSKTYNGEMRTSEKDFEPLQLGAFATPGLLLAQGLEGLTAESGLNPKQTSAPAYDLGDGGGVSVSSTKI
jgi:hypothetical protein